jgi:cellobiose-specific phosphotransferase system component IIB
MGRVHIRRRKTRFKKRKKSESGSDASIEAWSVTTGGSMVRTPDPTLLSPQPRNASKSGVGPEKLIVNFDQLQILVN